MGSLHFLQKHLTYYNGQVRLGQPSKSQDRVSVGIEHRIGKYYNLSRQS